MNTVREVFILREHQILAHHAMGVTAVQTSPTQLAVELEGDQRSSLTTDIQVRGVYVTEDTVTVWNGHRVAVYDIIHDTNRFLSQGAFNVECEILVVYEKSVYTLENMKINIRTYQGTVKQSLSLSETEGLGIRLDLHSAFLVCTTLNGCIRMWDLSRRDAKPHSHPKYLPDHIQDFGEIISAKCNYNATKLYIWDVENDAILYFNFASGKNDQDDSCIVPPNSARSDRRSAERQGRHREELAGRVAVAPAWDSEEPRLLVAEARLVPGAERSHDIRSQLASPLLGGLPQPVPPTTVIVSMFVLEDAGVVVHESNAVEEETVKLLALAVPHYILLRGSKNLQDTLVEKKMLRDFAGLQMTDKKTKRLDVAAICLGNMGHAAGARAVRKAVRSKEEPDVQAAILAVHLNMLEEAERLLIGCGRFDMLNKLYQNSGQWNKALDVCENNDRSTCATPTTTTPSTSRRWVTSPPPSRCKSGRRPTSSRCRGCCSTTW